MEALKGKGKFILPSGNATSTNLAEAEKVRLMWLLQVHEQRMFYKLGYKYVLANNTSPVTQQIARSMGYKTLYQYRVAEIELKNGEKPFKDKAPITQLCHIDQLDVQTVVPPQRKEIEEILKRELIEDSFEW